MATLIRGGAAEPRAGRERRPRPLLPGAAEGSGPVLRVQVTPWGPIRGQAHQGTRPPHPDPRLVYRRLRHARDV